MSLEDHIQALTNHGRAVGPDAIAGSIVAPAFLASHVLYQPCFSHRSLLIILVMKVYK